MNKLNEYIKNCTSKLATDRAIYQEVTSELKSHLESSVEDYGGVDEALRHFGDSSAIANELFSANLPRIKFRAKIKLALKIIMLPLIATVILCAFDRDSVDSGLSMMYLETSNHPVRDFIPAYVDIFFADNAPVLSPEDTFKLKSDTAPGQKDKAFLELIERYPNNKIYWALYLNALYGTPNQNDFVRSELEKYSKKDPHNGYYDIMLSGMELSDYFWKDEKAARESQEQLATGMKHYLNGVAKQEINDYSTERGNEISDIFGTPGNTRAVLARTTAGANILLPVLAQYRTIAKANIAYAKANIAAGNYAEAEKVLDTYPDFLRKINQSSGIFIGQLVCSSIGKIYLQDIPELYREIGRTEKARFAEKQLTEFVDVQKNISGENYQTEIDKNKKYGGILTRLLFANIRGTSVSLKELRPERMLSYNLLDTLFLSVAISVSILIALMFYMMSAINYLRRKIRNSLILLPWRYNLKIVAFGVIVPAVILLFITRIDFFSGRGVAIEYNKVFWCWNILWLLLPVAGGWCYCRFLRKYNTSTGGEKLSIAIIMRNLAPAMVFIGLAMLLIYRPLLAMEKASYIKQDTLFYINSCFVSQPESAVAQKLQQSHAEVLNQKP